jgi:hypothetical protein
MKENEFYKKFDMQVRPSQRRLRRIPNMWQHTNAWDYTINDNAMYQQHSFPVEEVECVEVLMPKDRLKSIVDYIDYCERSAEKHETDRQLIARYEQDRIVRLKNPAVEKAYQRYVILLDLARK